MNLTSSLRLSVFCLLLAASPASADRLDEQRKAFREAHAAAELGVAPDAATRKLLADYVLWPDLQAAWYRARLRQRVIEPGIDAFIEQHEALRPVRELRYRYALALHRAGRQNEFLALYNAHYADRGIDRLDCLALRAELPGLDSDELRTRLAPLWVVPHSQADECDPVFAAARSRGVLDEPLIRERFELALERRELAMARYLARQLDEDARRRAATWTRVYGEPAAFLARERRNEVETRRQLVEAVRQLAYRQATAAATAWQRLAGQLEFSEAERADITRHVALWLARQHDAAAADALAALAPAAVDGEVRRWRVRTALREGRMADALRLLDELGPQDRDNEQWHYWRAVLTEQAGNADAARAIYETLATERSYYGFLAADAIGADYALTREPLEADETKIATLAARNELVRARELFHVGLDGRARSEWDAATAKLERDELAQAAILADRWGWHSRAIALAARIDHYDDLDLRYPLAHAESFASAAGAAGVPPSWAYGVARSESLFMPDVRSSAGAVGIMQLMPGTARQTARALGTSWRGQATLTDPAANIRLGTAYLGEMHARFGSNPVLATAAYNAGPHRVENWLPAGDSLDARIWIETIPYRETRRYVRRVLTADTIFEWRLAGQVRRLSTRLEPVLPAAALAQLAAVQP